MKDFEKISGKNLYRIKFVSKSVDHLKQWKILNKFQEKNLSGGEGNFANMI